MFALQRRSFLRLILLAPVMPALGLTPDQASPPISPLLPAEPWRTDPATLALWRRARRLPLLDSDDPLLAGLVAAVRANRPIRFRYHGGSAPATLREITPGHLYTVDGFPGTYLSGYCHLRQAERTFLASRIRLVSTGEQHA